MAVRQENFSQVITQSEQLVIQTQLPKCELTSAVKDLIYQNPNLIFSENGMNYTYNGRVWNIKMEFSYQDNQITALYCCIYSSDTIGAIKFSLSDNKVLCSLEHPQYRHYMNVVLGTDNVEQNTLKILQNTTPTNSREYPKNNKLKNHKFYKDFFSSCPTIHAQFLSPNDRLGPEALLDAERLLPLN